MSVDYSANFGIGYKVSLSDEELGELGTHMADFLEETLKLTNYMYFETGEGAYTGEDNDFYVILNHEQPLEYVMEDLEDLEHFLTDNGIKICSDGGLVGGLLVH